MKKCRSGQAGFSLVELVATVGIIGLMVAIVAPMYGVNLPRFRLKGAARMVVGDFQRAKLEAVKRNCDVQIRFTPGAYVASGEVGTYQIVEMVGGVAGVPPLLTRSMPKNVTLYLTNLVANQAGYNSQGLALNSGSVFLVSNQAVSYKLSISTVGHVSMSVEEVNLAALAAW